MTLPPYGMTVCSSHVQSEIHLGIGKSEPLPRTAPPLGRRIDFGSRVK